MAHSPRPVFFQLSFFKLHFSRHCWIKFQSSRYFQYQQCFPPTLWVVIESDVFYSVRNTLYLGIKYTIIQMGKTDPMISEMTDLKSEQ